MTLQDRRILITGAAQGIGREIAHATAQLGAEVALFDRNDESVARVEEELRTSGHIATSHTADISDPDAMLRGVREVEATLGGPLDSLVVNAGVALRCALTDLKPALWEHTITVNLNGSYYTYKACESSLLSSRSARKAIVVIASASAFSGSGAGVHYAASKAGQIGMMLGLARALGPKGITVNAIAPRTIHTSMLDELYPSKAELKGVGDRVMIGRIGTPRDIAETTVFLLSDGSSFIHGQTIVVDGGRGLG